MGIGDRSGPFRAALAVGRGAALDPLAVFDDTFVGGSSSITTRGWSEFKATAGVATTVDTAQGIYPFEVIAGDNGPGGNTPTQGSFWFNASTGRLLYKEIDGDCEMVQRITVQNAAGSGVPPASSYRLAGIAAHDPNRTALNYEHAALGVVNGVVQSAEWKDTRNSVSAFGGTSIGVWDAWLRLRRVGQVFTMAHSPDGVDWTDYHTTDRAAVGPAMPDVLQWGMHVYSNAIGHDIRGLFRAVTFRRPPA